MRTRAKSVLVAAGAAALLAVGAGQASATTWNGQPHYGDNYEHSSSGDCVADEYLSNFSGFDHQKAILTQGLPSGSGGMCHIWLVKNGSTEYSWTYWGTWSSSWAGDGPGDQDYVCVQEVNAANGLAADTAACFSPY